MLTAPDENNRPLFAAKDIKDFYLENCPKIFPQERDNLASHTATTMKCLLSGPKYDGNYLRPLLRNKLGETKLHDKLTNIVNNDPSLDALLSDICLGTLAAPTYLPAHYFKTKIQTGKLQNTTSLMASLIAIGEIRRKKKKDQFLVLSLGTGSAQIRRYVAKKASKWSSIRWLKNHKSKPLLDVIFRAIKDITDRYSSIFAEDVYSSGNFLRIQDETLVGITSSVDVAPKKNLKDLVKVGEKLLKKPISTPNLHTQDYVPSTQETNEEALIRLAKILSKEKRLRGDLAKTKESSDSTKQLEHWGINYIFFFSFLFSFLLFLLFLGKFSICVPL
ncbi:hypothetical protein ABFS83_13G086000 [Erythranthe nasuta]